MIDFNRWCDIAVAVIRRSMYILCVVWSMIFIIGCMSMTNNYYLSGGSRITGSPIVQDKPITPSLDFRTTGEDLGKMVATALGLPDIGTLQVLLKELRERTLSPTSPLPGASTSPLSGATSIK